MQIPHDALLLRIFIGENDRHGHSPLMKQSCSRRTRCISPARPYCADPWASAIYRG
jgi:hypothetical protein